MGYQLKLELLDRPKKELAPEVQKAIALAANDWATFLYNTMYAATPRKTGKLASSIKKLVFGNKGSVKVYYDTSVAPYAVEVMRGNKSPRTISARGKALKFVARDGTLLYRRSVKRPRTFGLRIPEKMRNDSQVIERLRTILVAWLNTQITGKAQTINLSPVTVG